MKRTLAMLLASLFVLQMIPSAVFADTAAQVPEVRNVVTVSFGGDEYIFADGYTMEILPEAEERERYIFDGWYDGDTKIEAPFTPESDMVLEARYVHRGTLIAESGYTELWYTGDADVPSVTAVKALLPEGEEQLEAYIFAPASAAEVDIEFKASGRLYALDDSGAAAADLGWAEAGTGMTVSPQTVRGYCLAKAAEEKEAALVLSGKSGSGNVVLSVEKTEYAPALTSSSGEKVTEYETLYAASFAVTDGRGTLTRASAAVSYTDGAVLEAAVAGKHIAVIKDGEEIPFEIENDTLTFALSGQGRVGIYAFDDIVSWTWGQAPAAPGTRTAKSAAAKAGEYRMSMSGMMPWGTSAAVETRKAVIPGEEVLYAAEFTLYNAYGYEIEPGNGPVQVTVAGAGIGEAESLRVFRVEGKETREITGVTLEGDRVTFEADAAGLYAVTETLEQIVSIGGATYKITVAYGRDAMIPVGAELDVKEVSGDKYIADTAAALEVGEGDDIFYTKFLDISIVADGKVIEPQAPVQVTVELLDAEAGAEALEVVHFGDRGAEKVDAAADADGRVTFMADSFSTYGFGSVLRALLSWSSDAVTYTLQGFSSLLAPTYTAITVQAEEGLEALGAYRVDSLLGSLLNMLYVKVSAPVALGERESVAVYSVNDGEIGELLSEGAESGSIALGGAEGFAVVKDTGYRHMTFDLGQVTLDGMMPKAAEASALDALMTVTGEWSQTEDIDGIEPVTLAAYDISLSENGAEYQPDADHPIAVTISSASISDARNISVWHIRTDGEKEKITQFTVDGNTVFFEAPSFSIYAVVDEGDTSDKARMTVEFYNGTTLLERMYVKNDDTLEELEMILYDPGVGRIDSNQLFKGWMLEKPDYSVEDAANSMNIEEIRTWAEQRTITENETVKFYAGIFNTYSVSFRDNDHVRLHGEALIFKGTEGPIYTVDVSYTPKEQDAHFEGWYYTSPTDNAVTDLDGNPIDGTSTVIPNGTQVRINGNVIFTVSVPTGHWLIFDENGYGATYNAPQFIEDGETTAAPPDPTRNGYIFGGWYTDRECTSGHEFTFGNEINEKTTVYAKWIPNQTATYTLIVWNQSVTDNWDTADAAKTYDFVFSTELTANSNTAINALNLSAYQNKDGQTITVDGVNYSFYGFKYNSTKGPVSTDTVVQPNGTTVVNLYYDREIVTYDFKIQQGYTNAGTPDWNSGTTYYIKSGNNYYQCYRDNQNTYYFVPFTGNKNNNTTYYVLLNGEWYEYKRVNFGTWYNPNYQWVLEYNGNYYNWDGTVYSRTRVFGNQTYYIENWTTRETYTGLYGQKLSKYNYTWPTDLRWFNEVNGNTFTSVMDMFGASVNSNPSNEFHSDFYGYASSFNTNVYHYLQNVDGTWPTTPNFTIPTGVGNGMVFRNFQGYTASTFRIKLPDGVNTYQTGTAYNGNNLVNPVSHTVVNGWTDWLPYGTGVEYNGNSRHETDRWDATEGGIEFRYTRMEFPLAFMVGRFVNVNNETQPAPISGTLKVVTDIVYEEPLSSYAAGEEDYYDPGNQDGYVFAGWYVDETCTTPIDFSATKMPMGGISVYGKWIKKQYRIFLHPQVPTSDTSLDWGSDSTELSFRVNYGEKISAPTGQREDYEFIGWYLDEACTQPFNADAYVLNDTTVITPYNKTEDTELDWYGNTKSGYEGVNSDSVNNRFWIDRKLDLYAKWRAKIVGAPGINVQYTANESDEITGHFDGGSTLYTDPTTYYLDRAEAISAPASTPDSTQKQFNYWVVQRWNGTEFEDTDIIVYPGDSFEVLKDYAHVVVQEYEPDGTTIKTATYTVQLRAAYKDIDSPTPTHITWYSNNNLGQSVSDTNLNINQAVNIKPANTFAFNGYEFKGWARVDETDAEGNPHTIPTDYTEYTPWLEYDADTDAFYVTENDIRRRVTKVAADERLAYHGLIAVWEPKLYTVTVIKNTEPDKFKTEEFVFTPSFQGLDAAVYSDPFVLTGDPSSDKHSKTFVNVPFNTVFSINETANDEYDLSVVYSVADADDPAENKTNANTTNGEELTVKGNMTLVFNNSRNFVDLTITKVVTGGMGEKSRDFAFTIQVPGTPEGTKYDYVKGENAGKLNFSNGVSSFTLRDGETIIVSIPQNKQVILIEDDSSAGVYTKTWSNVVNGTVSRTNYPNDTLTISTLDEDRSVTIINDLPAIAPTGVRMMATPYLLMLLAGVALLLLRARRATGKGGGAV